MGMPSRAARSAVTWTQFAAAIEAAMIGPKKVPWINPIITGTAVYEVTSGGQDRTVPLRFTAIWAKRSSGPEFVSWQSTGIPPRQ